MGTVYVDERFRRYCVVRTKRGFVGSKMCYPHTPCSWPIDGLKHRNTQGEAEADLSAYASEHRLNTVGEAAKRAAKEESDVD